MVLDFLLGALLAVLNGVLGLVPAWSPPTVDPSSGVGGALAFVAWGNRFFPVRHVFLALGVVLSFSLFVSLWVGVVYVYRLIPFKFT